MSQPSGTDSLLSKADRKHGSRLGCEGYTTTAEAAVKVGMSEKTIWRWLKAGLVRHIKTDSRKPTSAVRICRRSLDEFLASRERAATRSRAA